MDLTSGQGLSASSPYGVTASTSPLRQSQLAASMHAGIDAIAMNETTRRALPPPPLPPPPPLAPPIAGPSYIPPAPGSPPSRAASYAHEQTVRRLLQSSGAGTGAAAGASTSTSRRLVDGATESIELAIARARECRASSAAAIAAASANSAARAAADAVDAASPTRSPPRLRHSGAYTSSNINTRTGAGSVAPPLRRHLPPPPPPPATTYATGLPTPAARAAERAAERAALDASAAARAAAASASEASHAASTARFATIQTAMAPAATAPMTDEARALAKLKQAIGWMRAQRTQAQNTKAELKKRDTMIASLRAELEGLVGVMERSEGLARDNNALRQELAQAGRRQREAVDAAERNSADRLREALDLRAEVETLRSASQRGQILAQEVEVLRQELARAASRQQEAVDAVERSHADRLRTTQAELDAARGIAAEGTAQLKQLAREAEDEARRARDAHAKAEVDLAQGRESHEAAQQELGMLQDRMHSLSEELHHASFDNGRLRQRVHELEQLAEEQGSALARYRDAEAAVDEERKRRRANSQAVLRAAAIAAAATPSNAAKTAEELGVHARRASGASASSGNFDGQY